MQFTDAGAATGTAVVTFDTMSLLAPRGRFEVEMYLSSLKLTGQVSPFMASEPCDHVVHQNSITAACQYLGCFWATEACVIMPDDLGCCFCPFLAFYMSVPNM